MVWGMQCGCEPAGLLVIDPVTSRLCAARASGRGNPVRGVRVGRQSVVNLERRTELSDSLLLRILRKEASVLCSNVGVPESPICKDRTSLYIAAAASRALQEKASVLFGDVCVNPKVVSPEAVEFMLSVAASQSVLSLDESDDASHVDLTLQGVHPGTFGPVLLVCTTTMFAAAIEKPDVEKALRRAQLWRRAVGPSFSVLPVVAGYVLRPVVADFANNLGVLSCNINQ